MTGEPINSNGTGPLMGGLDDVTILSMSFHLTIDLYCWNTVPVSHSTHPQ